MISPKTSVILGLVFSIAAWLALLGGFGYALLESDVPVQPGDLSPRRFTMAMSTGYAFAFSGIGCVLGGEGLVKKVVSRSCTHRCPTQRPTVAGYRGGPTLAPVALMSRWRLMYWHSCKDRWY